MGNILCPGEILIDFIYDEKCDEKKSGARLTRKAGGAPANAAAAIKRFNANPIIAGCVGNDSFGDFLIDTLNRFDIKTNYVKRKNMHTTLAFVFENEFEFVRGADELLTKKDIPKKIISDCSIFHFCSATAFLGGNLEDTYNYLLGFKDKIISYDPNFREKLFPVKSKFIKKAKGIIRVSDILKVSSNEALMISGKNNIHDSIRYLLNLGVKIVLVTLGEKGTIIASKTKMQKISSIKVKEIDPTGAGDAFIGSFLAQISNLSKKDICFDLLKGYVKISNIAAALTVTKKGAMESIPYKKQVQKYIS